MKKIFVFLILSYIFVSNSSLAVTNILVNQICNTNDKLIDLSLKDFSFLTASESPAPGGGSISAYCGAMGAALATMVANLSANKRGWDDRWQEFSQWAEKGFEFQ